MAPMSSRKRKRVSNESPMVLIEGDTIAVTPLRAARTRTSEQIPLSESHMGGYAARSARYTDTISTRAQDTANSYEANAYPHRIVPPDCCYFCRTRGGNAAYECFKEEDEERCTRCIRERKTKCRLPTEEEAAKIAARCPRCTTRGFKTCDGGDPCDTCIRNRTPHICRQLPTKKIKCEDSPSRDAWRSGSSRATTVNPRRVRTSTRRSGARHGQVDRDDEQPTTVDHVALFAESVLQEILGEEHATNSRSTSPVAALRTPDESASRDSTAPAEEQAKPRPKIRHLRNALPSPATSNDQFGGNDVAMGTASSDEDVIMVDATDRFLSPARIGRSRRARPRVSYVDPLADDISVVSYGDDDEGEDTDAYTPPPIYEESEVEFDSASSDHELSDDSDAGSVEGEIADDVSLIEDEQPKLASESRKQTKSGKSSKSKPGVDLNLPPLSNIHEIFADMALKAEELGLCDVLNKLELSRNGHSAINVRHCFSAEIEVVKQAYIERNFQPELLFRDVREFIPKGSTATTAYGAEVTIPGNLDILIAGFVCKDLSRLNMNRKDLASHGESGDTFRAIYNYADQHRPRIILLENVKAKTNVWVDLVSQWDKIGYEARWVILDTKDYYLPQTRQRMYMIAVERKLYGKDACKAADQWGSIMQKLQRRCSSPYEAFISEVRQESDTHSTIQFDPDWVLSKLRYDHIRAKCLLGMLRTLTKWNETGTILPPDFANRKWYRSQSSRVYDAIEVAHLLFARMGLDSTYKMAIWDVSQNVDRFNIVGEDFERFNANAANVDKVLANVGIVPCITPDGCDFATNRHQALNGSQLLVLQGQPLQKLLFARETQKDRQDLAGNAMSTTVIGASIVSAIISALRPQARGEQALIVTTRSTPLPTAALVEPISMKEQELPPDFSGELDMVELTKDAILSSQLCNCEGSQDLCNSAVQVCSSCEHTACSACAGNPKHTYMSTIPTRERTITPHDFVQKWKHQLPARLMLQDFPSFRQVATKMKVLDTQIEAYVSQLDEADVRSQVLCIRDMQREENAWAVTYTSSQVTLKLQIGRRVQWSLFVECPRDLASNDPLRKMLEHPIAHAVSDVSLVHVDWQLYIPHSKSLNIRVNGSVERTGSWGNRLGLPDCKSETVPMKINIQSQDIGAQDLVGEYEHLPHCGTACNSLYKRSGEQVLYMFLDPNPVGPAKDDGMVFSQDCSRKHYGDARIISARLNPSWRPWLADGALSATCPGIWVPTTMKLSSASISMIARTPQVPTSIALAAKSCSEAVTVLDVELPERLSTQNYHEYAWALESAKSLPSYQEWQEFNSSTSDDCVCAPSYPQILWHVDSKGMATAHEDRKAAAAFERSLKTRKPIFQVVPSESSGSTRIRVGVNVASLVHRARNRLTNSTNSPTSAWRLLVDHTDITLAPMPKFQLRSNSKDVLSTAPPAVGYLRGKQLKSLAWMRSQEQGRQFTVTEVEEAVEHDLGWRIEARAQSEVQVRGGVLADLPSFGKTVTTIALVQTEFEEQTPKSLLRDNQTLASDLPGLEDLAATLIVCPPHIVEQWQLEFDKFLGATRFKAYNILLVKDFDQLQAFTIEDFREARVIILSWAVFAEEDYIDALAQFAAMPKPAATSRRAINVWLDRVTQEISRRISTLDSIESDYQAFQKSSAELLEERLNQEEFQVTLPVKIQHGSAYQSYNTMKAASSAAKKKPQLKRKVSRPAARTRLVPLLHLFRFNRVVVDEYHYLNDDKKIANILASAAVKHVTAIKRWVLSGTPALANFSDIDQIASYLGLKLGRYYCGNGSVITQLEKARRAEQTSVEDFIAQTEIMSQQWHRARHDRAQEFLDLFVRQNEPSLEHIKCSEMLVPVELDVAHHTIYLELSQHLISQKMQLKKLTKKSESDRIDRMTASLNDSASAEEALLKSALLFETKHRESSLDLVKNKRTYQRRGTEKELLMLLAGFQGRRKYQDVSVLLKRFVEDIENNCLGDADVTRSIQSMLSKAAKDPDQKAFPHLKSMTTKTRPQEVRKLEAQLRVSAGELTLRTRSERFFRTIQDVVQMVRTNDRVRCSSAECKGTCRVSDLRVVSQCGHKACEECLELRTDDGKCVDSRCNAPVPDHSLIKVSELGSTVSAGEHSFGTKLDAVAQILRGLPDDDQALVFAPTEETVAILEDVLDHHDITFLSPGRGKASARMIEAFKSNNSPKKEKKVLILNLGSEAAAGINLTVANHIIFVSPLLAKSQYDYESAMAQAIARSRRYGQEKKVHIYHIVAQRTIDVDILEHRHKRKDGITTSTSMMKMPESLSTKKVKTKLVKNNQDEMALVPCSWLADPIKREVLGVGEAPESFTSLINFSESFEQDDDE